MSVSISEKVTGKKSPFHPGQDIFMKEIHCMKIKTQALFCAPHLKKKKYLQKQISCKEKSPTRLSKEAFGFELAPFRSILVQ